MKRGHETAYKAVQSGSLHGSKGCERDAKCSACSYLSLVLPHPVRRSMKFEAAPYGSVQR